MNRLIHPRSTPRAWLHGLRRLAMACLFCFARASQAHIGSPNVFFEGPAGPYPIRVVMQAPSVIPGLAQIHVRTHSADVQSVTVLPVRWNLGTSGSPPPDTATRVPGETNLFTAQLWLMDSGAYSVFVDVTGSRGRGTAIVPLDAVASRRLEMPRWKSVVFLGVGIFLAALLASVVGTAIRESALAPGAEPERSRRWRAGLAMGITVAITAGLSLLGNTWWDKVDETFRTRRLAQPPILTPKLVNDPGGEQLSLSVTASSNRREDSTPLIPDHGHIMHLFLIRQPAGDVFAHLHPTRDSTHTEFETRLPALPAGDYLLFADITHESGLSQTLTNHLKLGGASGSAALDGLADPDDSLQLTAPLPLSPSDVAGGFQVTPQFTLPFRANTETTLRFEVTTNGGAPVLLESYLGMYGHLILQRADGAVFAHLHPLGSISMASQRRFAQREQAGYLANQSLDLLCSPAERTLSFPYAFPAPGRYRLWLQFKLQGQIRTVAYFVDVD